MPKELTVSECIRIAENTFQLLSKRCSNGEFETILFFMEKMNQESNTILLHRNVINAEK